MRAWRALVLADLGEFDDALHDADRVLGHHDTAPVSAIPAAAAAARVLSRRGEDASARLRLARSLARETGELQRVGAAACAAAEDAWLTGETASVAAVTEEAWALAVQHADPWTTGELAWWRMLAGLPAPADVLTAPPFAALLSSSAEGARAWDATGSPIWSAYARVLSVGAEDAAHAVALLEGVRAERAVQALLRERRMRGLPLPRRPHPANRARPGQLTMRELDVLRLLADGLSTAEIARRLVLSPRTVEHHVSAVLVKLGEPTRARAVAVALRTGVLVDDPSGGAG
jgi:DNA-binding CsgD family transcriptional regulator